MGLKAYVLYRCRSILVIGVNRARYVLQRVVGRLLLNFRVILRHFIVIRIVTNRVNGSASYRLRSTSALLYSEIQASLRGNVLTSFVHRFSRWPIRYSEIKNNVFY